jgi:hypothetical protein
MTKDQARCAHCPIPEGLICRGEDVRRLCEIVDPEHAAYNPGYIRVLMSLAQGAPFPHPSFLDTRGGVPFEREWRSDAPPPRLPSVAEALKLIEAMKTCPFRSVDPGCGCVGARCGLRVSSLPAGEGSRTPRRGSVVSYTECFDCLRLYAIELKYNT